jgi:hypothetical protein
MAMIGRMRIETHVLCHCRTRGGRTKHKGNTHEKVKKRDCKMCGEVGNLRRGYAQKRWQGPVAHAVCVARGLQRYGHLEWISRFPKW